MSLYDADTKGRAVAQHFFTELEKIAYSRLTTKLYGAARAAGANVDAAAATLGKKRFVPFTPEHRAYFGHAFTPGSGVKGVARQAANAAEAQATKERSAMLTALQRGKGNTEGIVQRLAAGPQSVGPVASPLRSAVRAVGGTAPVEGLEPPKGMSPGVRRAVAGVGLAGAGAAGLYAGQQYLNRDQQPQYY